MTSCRVRSAKAALLVGCLRRNETHGSLASARRAPFDSRGCRSLPCGTPKEANAKAAPSSSRQWHPIPQGTNPRPRIVQWAATRADLGNALEMIGARRSAPSSLSRRCRPIPQAIYPRARSAPIDVQLGRSWRGTQLTGKTGYRWRWLRSDPPDRPYPRDSAGRG